MCGILIVRGILHKVIFMALLVLDFVPITEYSMIGNFGSGQAYCVSVSVSCIRAHSQLKEIGALLPNSRSKTPIEL